MGFFCGRVSPLILGYGLQSSQSYPASLCFMVNLALILIIQQNRVDIPIIKVQ